MSAHKIIAQVISSVLLFFLVMGMASTVDIRDMRKQIRNVKAVSIGLFCQFVILPFLGYIVVMIFSLPYYVGITLIIVVSSPGGSYSNWWCSLLNADLALSVSMTTVSTFLSVCFLPLNLAMYSYAAYGDAQTSSGESVMKSINFASIFISLAVVISAIGTGIFCSYKFDTPRWHRIAYLGGNISGILLVVFSILLSFIGGPDGDDPKAENVVAERRDAVQYIAICLPCLLGLVIATTLASLAKLVKPERLTTAVECCYQNTGIATSAAISLFEGDELQEAMRVPVVYGFAEAVLICIHLLLFWKLGWSKAPRDEKCCTVLTKSYELHNNSREDDDEGRDDDDDGKTIKTTKRAEIVENGSEDEWNEQGDSVVGSLSESLLGESAEPDVHQSIAA